MSNFGERPFTGVNHFRLHIRLWDGCRHAGTHLLGISFEPRIPQLSDRRLYRFEPRARYGTLAPLFGQRLDAELIKSHWDEIGPIIAAMCDRTLTPSLILKKLSAYRQQNGVAAALREIGRALSEMRTRGLDIDETLIPQLSPLGWDHINFTGDYVWSDDLALGADGFMPLRQAAL